jgi:phenylalanyl-tRNA synthetase beta chain
MKISLNWLKKYLNTDCSPDELSTILTDIGLEVESLYKKQSIEGGLEGVVAGKVLTCAKHPNADSLSITTVDIGQADIKPIVCGAPNVAQGQTVLVAQIGATLYPKGGEAFTIKKAKIRGEASEGMICAEDELGIGVSHDGIMVLPDNVKPGTPASEYLKLEDDYIFEIGLTPNRIDAASHYGVARDLYAYLVSHGREASLSPPDVSAYADTETEKPVSLTVENEELCPRYTGVVIKGVKVAPSPDWLQASLKSIGLNPINNVVDATNYVLHSIGQPLHAFDLDKVGGQINVRCLDNGCSFTALDGTERKLANTDLMIANATEGMCMAGIMGGLKSGVSASTSAIFLESANFSPASVRKTARRHGLNSDSSFRFERGADPNICAAALKQAALLICDIANGRIASAIYDTCPQGAKGHKVNISIEKINKLIGQELSKEEILKILSLLDIQITSDNAGNIELEVPAYRVDVTRQEDIVEELLRIYGYNRIDMPKGLKSAIIINQGGGTEKIKNRIADFLAAQGFCEIMCNSLTKKTYYGDKPVVEIINPLSAELNTMRSSLLFGGLESAARNINHKRPNIKFFEFGNTYHYNPEAEGLKKYTEKQELLILVSGKKNTASWNSPEADAGYYFLKQIVFNVLEQCKIPSSKITELPHNSENIEGAELSYNNKHICFLGLVKKQALKQCGMQQAAFACIIDWDSILQSKKPAAVFSELPKFPEVRRDLSLLVDEKVCFSDLKAIACKAEKKLLKEVGIFDVFSGKGVPEGKKSYAMSFILQDNEKTLIDKQIDACMSKILTALETQAGASLR